MGGTYCWGVGCRVVLWLVLSAGGWDVGWCCGYLLLGVGRRVVLWVLTAGGWDVGWCCGYLLLGDGT